MTRIDAILKYISLDDKIIDVGCDRALLSKKLAKKNMYSIASDIKQNIIDNAINSTDSSLLKYIDFRVGDGITLKDNEKDYSCVLSGMGTYTILNILKESKIKPSKVITISNNNHDILRKEMTNNGYKILLEEIVKEKGKYYNLIIFVKGKQSLNDIELLVGYNHQNKELLKERNNYLINKYSKITKNKELIEIVNVLKNYQY